MIGLLARLVAKNPESSDRVAGSSESTPVIECSTPGSPLGSPLGIHSMPIPVSADWD